uniref:Uncharacterized protein n=1 Tax=Arundo donax TaxID=35708 RepID=A0A0A9HTD6_ARUDO
MCISPGICACPIPTGPNDVLWLVYPQCISFPSRSYPKAMLNDLTLTESLSALQSMLQFT